MERNDIEQLVKESIDTFLTEGKSKKGTVKNGNHRADIFYDSDDQEYTVKFYKNGQYQSKADYYTDDKDDAFGTAEAQLKRY